MTLGGDKPLAFTLQCSYNDEDTFSNFRGIEVDGVAVEGIHYDATQGSVNIRLKAAFLNTLSVGEHTLKVLFNDGEAATTVTVLAADEERTVVPQDNVLPANTQAPKAATQKNSTSPVTGDTGNVRAIALLISAGVATASVILSVKKKRQSNHL